MRSKISSATREPQEGYLAFVYMGHNNQRSQVESVGNGGTAVTLRDETGSYRALRDDSGGWFLEDSGRRVRFVRNPRVGDVARFKGPDGNVVTLRVSSVLPEHRRVIPTGGTWAVLRQWGVYTLNGSNREVEFTEYVA